MIPNEKQKAQEIEQAQYFEDGGFAVYATRGPLGAETIFRCFQPLTAQTQWEIVKRGSLTWDALHQEIFRSWRFDALTDAARIATFPPLPVEPPTRPLSWTENFLPKEPLLAQRFPNVAAWIDEQERQTGEPFVTLHLVLTEDYWDAVFGDGIYRSLKAVCLNLEQAQKVEETPGHGERLSLARVFFALDTDGEGQRIFDLSQFNVPHFSHFEPHEVLQLASLCCR